MENLEPQYSQQKARPLPRLAVPSNSWIHQATSTPAFTNRVDVHTPPLSQVRGSKMTPMRFNMDSAGRSRSQSPCPLESHIDSIDITPERSGTPPASLPRSMRNLMPESPRRPLRPPGMFQSQASIQLQSIPSTPRTLLAHIANEAHAEVLSDSTEDDSIDEVLAKHSPMKRRLPDSFKADRQNLMRRRPSIFHEPAFRGKHNVSRLKQEFIQLEVLGKGDFGTVYKYQHRLDGVVYAIKRSNKPIAGLADEQRLLKEVIAHAAVNVQPHIVRYFSAWEEDDHMLIQNEFCDGGNLEDEIFRRQESNQPFTESELREILIQVATGLACLHQQGFVHLDIKPANVFLSHSKNLRDTSMNSKLQQLTVNSAKRKDQPEDQDSGLMYDDLCSGFEGLDGNEDGDDDVFADEGACTPPSTPKRVVCMDEITYKIGDLGHATRIGEPVTEDGDARYLAPEVLEQDFRQLEKADIMSLGFSLFEAASLVRLPVNGPYWQQLRRDPPELPAYSHAFNEILRLMLQHNPAQRPSASDILAHPFAVRTQTSTQDKSREELLAELAAERARNFQLSQELQASKAVEVRPTPHKPMHHPKVKRAESVPNVFSRN